MSALSIGRHDRIRNFDPSLFPLSAMTQSENLDVQGSVLILAKE